MGAHEEVLARGQVFLRICALSRRYQCFKVSLVGSKAHSARKLPPELVLLRAWHSKRHPKSTSDLEVVMEP
jgi:hypothetical protein